MLPGSESDRTGREPVLRRNAGRRQVELIVRKLEEEEAEGGRANPVEDAISLATSHPEALAELAVAVMRRFPKGGIFLTAALSFLPEGDWPGLIGLALDAFEENPGAADDILGRERCAAENVLAVAGLQCPSALHPHLGRIFALRPNEGSRYELYPWRESGDLHVPFLRGVIDQPGSGDDERHRAWEALLETRRPAAIDVALSRVGSVTIADPTQSLEEWVTTRLHGVGFHIDGTALRRICPGTVRHLLFDDTFRPFEAGEHPTWRLPALPQAVPFGGVCPSPCSVCRGGLHRLLVLDPVPAGLGVSGVTRLELATCLSCLGWEQPTLFYRHRDDGSPSSIGYEGPVAEPQFGPLRETVARLADTPRRWWWQDYGINHGRENLSRLGGEPCWTQQAEYPPCPSCRGVMSFLMQLDSNLPTADGGLWGWGNGGMCYGFWCDPCKVSGFLMQDA
jgi:hypothetical protein